MQKAKRKEQLKRARKKAREKGHGGGEGRETERESDEGPWIHEDRRGTRAVRVLSRYCPASLPK